MFGCKPPEESLQKAIIDADTLTFEFLDAKGSVMATRPQPVPALTPGANQPFKLKVDVPGSVAWRYHRAVPAGASKD